ncbi:MAG: TetR/AcrR family transcriptional regulator [Bacteroidales bacterium]|nr:TetR/AcrR family transcriptional regulator [Bacteroidales bacterium]
MSNERREKTRQHFIEVARKLISERGRINVTMNDIATEAHMSRRTIYTYFANCDEVYGAILEYELTHLLQCLGVVMDMKLAPDKKLERFLLTHLEAVKEAVTHNNSLKNEFRRNLSAVERARQTIDMQEIRMIRTLLIEGKNQGYFRIESPQWSAIVVFYSLKGLEAPYLNNTIGNYFRDNSASIFNLILEGILTDEHHTKHS